jgi:hypothetical protein
MPNNGSLLFSVGDLCISILNNHTTYLNNQSQLFFNTENTEDFTEGTEGLFSMLFKMQNILMNN